MTIQPITSRITEPVTSPVSEARSPASYPHVQRYAIFNGTTSKVVIPHHADLQAVDKFSVGCWVQCTSDDPPTNPVAGQWDVTNSKKCWLMRTWTASANKDYRTAISGDGSAEISKTSPVVPWDAWQYLTLEYDGTAGTPIMRLTYDGTVNNQTSGVPASLFSSDADIVIGNIAAVDAWNSWSGNIRDVSLAIGTYWSVAQRTNVMKGHPDPSVTSRWSLEYDTLDRVGGHDGTPTAITYGP